MNKKNTEEKENKPPISKAEIEEIDRKEKKFDRILIAIIIVCLLIGGGAVAIIALGNKKPKPVTTTENKIVQEKTVEKQKRYASALDGTLKQTKDDSMPSPTEVMIENITTVRPQSGLSDASIVFEALAEGGITRFLAIFDHRKLDKIGPVRSARNYYLDWAGEFHGLYVHAGGSPTALSAIKNYDFTDLNALTNDGKYFWRDTAEKAPHNLFTKTDLLDLARRDKNLKPTSEYGTWKFKDDAGSWIGKTESEALMLQQDERSKLSKTQEIVNEDDAATVSESSSEKLPSDTTTHDSSTAQDAIMKEASSISLDFSSVGYVVKWEYDAQSNTYKRSNGGAAHLDRNTGKQITAKNIAVAKITTKPLDQTRLEMDTTKGGDAILFRDGVIFEGTWKKVSKNDRLMFYTKDSQEFEFNRGNTWVEIIPPDRKITY